MIKSVVRSILSSVGVPVSGKVSVSAGPEIPTGLTLTLISGGVQIDWADTNGATAQTEIWGQDDGGTSALLYTINAGLVTKNDICNPVDLRYYKIRGKKGTKYSEFTAEVSIVMLGAEVIINGDFTVSTGWICGADWTITGGKAVCSDAGGSYFYRTNNIKNAKKYRVGFNISNCATVASIQILRNESSGPCFPSPIDGQQLLANGNYVYYLTSIAAALQIAMLNYSATGASYSFDNLSVKEILFP
jgi:hypothetical protein